MARLQAVQPVSSGAAFVIFDTEAGRRACLRAHTLDWWQSLLELFGCAQTPRFDDAVPLRVYPAPEPSDVRAGAARLLRRGLCAGLAVVRGVRRRVPGALHALPACLCVRPSKRASPVVLGQEATGPAGDWAAEGGGALGEARLPLRRGCALRGAPPRPQVGPSLRPPSTAAHLSYARHSHVAQPWSAARRRRQRRGLTHTLPPLPARPPHRRACHAGLLGESGGGPSRGSAALHRDASGRGIADWRLGRHARGLHDREGQGDRAADGRVGWRGSARLLAGHRDHRGGCRYWHQFAAAYRRPVFDCL